MVYRQLSKLTTFWVCLYTGCLKSLNIFFKKVKVIPEVNFNEEFNGDILHANQARQREQNLLYPRRYSWVMLNVNVNCLEKTLKKHWRSSPRSIQSSPMNFLLKFTLGITLTFWNTLLISNNLQLTLNVTIDLWNEYVIERNIFRSIDCRCQKGGFH